MSYKECGDTVFDPASRLSALSQETGMDLGKLFHYVDHSEIVQAQPSEDVCRELVTFLTGPKIKLQDKRFLMAHLGLGEISADEEAGTIWVRPSATHYKTMAISAGIEALDVDFKDVQLAAGRLILDFARQPYGISTIYWYGCEVAQPSKNRKLKVNHLDGLAELFGVVTMEVKTV